MWPTLVDGSVAKFEILDDKILEVGQIILAHHPFRKDTRIIKRIQSIEKNKVFLIGDNPDPTASEDSHNFGMINLSQIFAKIIN